MQGFHVFAKVLFIWGWQRVLRCLSKEILIKHISAFLWGLHGVRSMALSVNEEIWPQFGDALDHAIIIHLIV